MPNMKPAKGSKCQEASPMSYQFYIACGRPAVAVVKGRDADAYLMCEGCADHNVRNRGARYVQEGENVNIYTPSDRLPLAD